MAKDCTTQGIYDSLNWCPGQHVLPGIRSRVYCIPKAWIAKWPKLPAIAPETLTMDKLATYEGNFVLLSDKKWFSIDLLDNKSGITSESQGEIPSKTFLNKGNLLFAGTDEMATGFCRQANTDQLVFLVQERGGKFRVLGSEAFSVEVKPSQASGEGVTGSGGTTIAVEATDICPAPFYPGNIELKAGTISGIDGSPVEVA